MLGKQDEAFVFSSWLRSFKKSKVNAGLDNEAYFDRQRDRINRILSRPSAYVLIVCDWKDFDHIFGYAALEESEKNTLVHYIYVKQAFRRHGIAKAIINHLRKITGKPLIATHYPARDELFDCMKKEHISYNPDL